MLTGNVDEPIAGSLVSRAAFAARGWVFDVSGTGIDAVVVRHGERELARTSPLFLRDDVNRAHGLEPSRACGFHVMPSLWNEDARELELTFVAEQGRRKTAFATIPVTVSTFDEVAEPYGLLAQRSLGRVLHRDDIYCVGPPSEVADPTCVELVLQRTRPGDRIVDVGCGVGAYAEPLQAAGRLWEGCEVDPNFVERVRARGLGATLANGLPLPFADRSFDVALSVEVLEHIEPYEPFVAELARISRRGALVSVPDAAAIPRLARRGVAPWHILERSHLNFFTLSSLETLLRRHFPRVDVVAYGVLPVAALDETPVYNHLFAVASHG